MHTYAISNKKNIELMLVLFYNNTTYSIIIYLDNSAACNLSHSFILMHDGIFWGFLSFSDLQSALPILW